MSDESSESDFDADDVMQELEGMKQLLKRHLGNVDIAHAQDKIKRWPNMTSIAVPSLEGEDRAQTARLVDMAEENEKKRRMSVPFTESLADDADLRETSDHVTTMQEELLHLFAIHDAKFQEECEKERRIAEVAKERMQEQLLKRASFQRTKQVMEEERHRRIREMEELLSEESEVSMAMADTNARLSLVHEDLLNAFRILQKEQEKIENDQRLLAEENKELVLQDIRRIPIQKKLREEFEVTKEEKIEEYNKRQNTRDNTVEMSLIQVQEDLLRIFGKLKKEKKVKKEMTIIDQSNRKELMHEELLHKAFGKQASQLEAEEKARRIREAYVCPHEPVTDEDRKKQKVMDMLIDVQKQLLDVMSSSHAVSLSDQSRHRLKGSPALDKTTNL